MPVIPRSIYIRHFGTVKEAELELPPPGLCLVLGSNLTSTGVKSIGSGKTLLGEAISRTLLGVGGRYGGAGLGAYSSDLCGNKDTLIKLTCELSGKPLVIWAGFKCRSLNPTGEGLRFKLGDAEPIERHTVRETRAELDQLLGTSKDLAEHALHLDGQSLKFNRLSERELIDLFLSATSAPNWDLAQKKVRRELAVANAERQTILGKQEAHRETIASRTREIGELGERRKNLAASLAAKRAAQAELVTEKKGEIKTLVRSCDKVEKRMTAIKVRLKDLEELKGEDYAKLDKQLIAAKLSLTASNTAYRSLLPTVTEHRNTASNLDKLIKSLTEPDKCPTCGKPWDKRSTTKLDEAKASLVVATAKLKETEKKFSQLEQVTEAETEKVDKVHAQIRELGAGTEVRALSQEYEKLELETEELIELVGDAEKELQKLEAPINDDQLLALDGEMKAKETQASEARVALAALDTKVVEVGAYTHILGYLETAFGPTGLANLLLQDYLSYLNRTAEQLSHTLTQNLVQISFATTKTLATTAERPQLVIHARHRTGAQKLSGASKGEGGIDNLIIAETLYSLGRLWQKVGYRWLDEAVNSQDEVVRGAVYRYFRGQAKLQDCLTFAVDHSADVEGHADHVILAEKAPDGFTSYRRL